MDPEAAGPAVLQEDENVDYSQEAVRPRRTYKLGEELTQHDVEAFDGEFECSICYSFQPLAKAFFVNSCRDFFCADCFS